MRVAPPSSRHELDAFAGVLSESLDFPPRTEGDALARHDPANLRLIRRGDQVVGGLALLRAGQFFCGQRVAMVGINAVAVAPEARGSGAGRELMTHTIAELAAEDDAPLAALYPATQPIYRSVGFEQAGTYTQYRIPVHSIPVGSHELPVERVPPDGVLAAELLGDLYRRVAARQNGFVDRTVWFWRRAVDPLTMPTTTFCVREQGRITGYVIMRRRWISEGHTHSEVSCRELVAETHAATRRLWALLADERSLARSLVITGPPTPADHMSFAEQAPEVVWQLRWMLRILDVERALEARGYLPGLAGSLELDIIDELVPANSGRFALEVAGGRGQVRHAPASESADVLGAGPRGLAALYSGYLPAEELARMGLVSGSPAALRTATSLFSAQAPWLPEIF